MSRQTTRAIARWEKKLAMGQARLAARVTKRKKKGLTPLSHSQAAGYPEGKYRPVTNYGNVYPFSDDRQTARYARQAEGHANG